MEKNAIIYVLIIAWIVVVVLGVWLNLAKDDIGILQYKIEQLEIEKTKVEAEVKEAKSVAEHSAKEMGTQLEESDKAIKELNEEIKRRDNIIARERNKQQDLKDKITELENKELPDLSNTTDGALAEEITTRLKKDYPEISEVKVLAASEFFFTREVAEAMNYTLVTKEQLREALKFSGEWLTSKEEEVEQLEGKLAAKDDIIIEKDLNIQTVLKAYQDRVEYSNKLQDSNRILESLASEQKDAIKIMKRRQWIERGLSFGTIAAIVAVALAAN